jgi:hypothetical protein
MLNEHTYLDMLNNLRSELAKYHTSNNSLITSICSEMLKIIEKDNPNYIETEDNQQTQYNQLNMSLSLMYYPLKHLCSHSLIAYTHPRKNEFNIYIYNGIFWQKVECALQFGRKVLHSIGYNPDRVLAKGYTKAIYETIKCIEKQLGTKKTNILNFKNGTLEFTKDGISFRNHSHDDWCTSVLPFDYDETATCTQMLECLNNVLDTDGQDKLLNFIASAMYPERIHQKMLNIHGKAGAGKSTIVKLLLKPLGEASIEVSFKSLINQGVGFSRDDTLYKVRGKSICFCDEVDNFGDKNMDTERFKLLVQGSHIHINTSAGAEDRDDVTAGIIISTSNKALDVSLVDDGVARRITSISCKDCQQNSIYNIVDIIYQTEAMGIINLIIKAYKNLLININDKSLFDSIESKIMREHNEILNLNPVEYAIQYAIDNGFIKIITDKPKTTWMNFKDLLKIVKCFKDGCNISSPRTIAKYLITTNINDIEKNAYSNNSRVVNLEFIQEKQDEFNLLLNQAELDRLEMRGG